MKNVVPSIPTGAEKISPPVKGIPIVTQTIHGMGSTWSTRGTRHGWHVVATRQVGGAMAMVGDTAVCTAD